MGSGSSAQKQPAAQFLQVVQLPAGAGGGGPQLGAGEPSSPKSLDGEVAEPSSPVMRILKALEQTAPKKSASTGTSLTLAWSSSSTDPNEMRLIQAYDVQWKQPCVRHQYSRRCGLTCAMAGNEGTFVQVLTGYGIKARCSLEWQSIPSGCVRRFERSVTVDGLPYSCAPMQFRVRARNHAGWANFSEPSEPVSTYPRPYMPKPQAGLVTFFSIELKWDPFVHWSAQPRYELVVQQQRRRRRGERRGPQGSDGDRDVDVDVDVGDAGNDADSDEPIEPYEVVEVGKACSYNMGGEGCDPLQPLDKYKIWVVADMEDMEGVVQYSNDGGDGERSKPKRKRMLSRPITVSTLPAPPPSRPEAPKAWRRSKTSLHLHWPVPASSAPIASLASERVVDVYFLYCKAFGPGKKFELVYRGPEPRCVVGAGNAAFRIGAGSRGGATDGGGPLEPNSPFSFRVSAANGGGISEFSEIVTLRTVDLGEEDDVVEGEMDGGAHHDLASSEYTESKTTYAADGGGGGGANPQGDHQGAASAGLLSSLSSQHGEGDGVGDSESSRTSDLTVVLPNGWIECWMSSPICCYYYHPASGVTQWEHPGGVFGQDKELEFRRKRFELLVGIGAVGDRADSADDADHEQRGGGVGGVGGAGRAHESKEEQDHSSDSNAPTTLRLDRRHILRDTFNGFRALSADVLRRKLRIEFSGEAGIDSGGIGDDWSVDIVRAVLDPSLCLFKQVGANEELFAVNPLSYVNELHLQYFRFFGRFLGKMVADRRVAEVPLCRALLRHLLGREQDLLCLAEIDPVKHQSLQWVLHNDVDGVIFESFTAVRDNFGVEETVELKAGGAAVTVTNENKREWVQAVVAWELGGSCAEQLRSFVSGFHEVVPQTWLADFSPPDLWLLLNGPRTIDIWRIRTATKYSGGFERLKEQSATVQFFWETLNGFDEAQRADLLKFSTGCTRIPLDGFTPPFTLVKSTLAPDSLPTSHTCFNQLVLPEFSSRATLEEKLVFALRHSTDGFQMS